MSISQLLLFGCQLLVKSSPPPSSSVSSDSSLVCFCLLAGGAGESSVAEAWLSVRSDFLEDFFFRSPPTGG